MQKGFAAEVFSFFSGAESWFASEQLVNCHREKKPFFSGGALSHLGLQRFAGLFMYKY